jgi:hypothetical protein
MTCPSGSVDTFAVDHHPELQGRCRGDPLDATRAPGVARRDDIALLDQHRQK